MWQVHPPRDSIHQETDDGERAARSVGGFPATDCVGTVVHDLVHMFTPQTVSHLDTAGTRLRIGHTRLNAHLGMTDSPHCPCCPTQPDTPEHLIVHCPRHHSHRVVLFHALSAIHPHRPTLTDLGGCTNTTQAFKTLNLTRTFLQKTNQLHRI
ncbi:hypothetical protein E2C01_001852 [Portunus trituberculatus]|uniref:Reverse transcriptase zinc-binding domain-containing protein n=1 Tax=Portunus trituberculatus TaxID=210409 RepID=A0A5B7CID3_PORTR|nr:hypothetical protein [Portunus trituberculatus]